MRALAAVNDRFTSEAPLPEATAMLMQAAAVANMSVPAVPRASSRQARRFRRAPTLLTNLRETRAGATRFVRSHTGAMATFAARARIPDLRRQQMASRLLMAGGNQRISTPKVHALDLLRARATAMNVIGRLRQRFALNALDLRDGKPDIHRLAMGRGRGLQHLVYA
ncbi:MAG: hypothetical protein EBQ96_07270 [Proteobacteria bacterium]|nr:hypothetical protein [Pseudomonadota bacterium]